VLQKQMRNLMQVDSVCANVREKVCVCMKKEYENDNMRMCVSEREQWQFIDDNFYFLCMYQVL
jgi:hypothetical protein